MEICVHLGTNNGSKIPICNSQVLGALEVIFELLFCMMCEETPRRHLELKRR